MASIWASKARGIYLTDKHFISDPTVLKDIDFVILWGSSGLLQHNANFKALSEQIRAAGKPVIVFHDIEYDYILEADLDGKRFRAPDDDPSVSRLDRVMFEGGVKTGKPRYSQAVMVNISDNQTGDGKTVTDAWVKEFGVDYYSLDMVWRRYRKPVYIYLSLACYNTYRDKPLSEQILTNWAANLKQDDALSTITAAFAPGAIESTLAAYPLPADSWRPDTVKMGAGIATMWQFAFTSWAKFRFAGIDGGAVPTVLYNGTREQLYQALDFTAWSEPPVVVEPPAEPEPPTVPACDLDGVLVALAEIRAILDRVAAVTEKVDRILK